MRVPNPGRWRRSWRRRKRRPRTVTLKSPRVALDPGFADRPVLCVPRLRPNRRKSAEADTVPEPEAKGSNPGYAVVGIGASAGGLDAFKRFFSAMPGKPGMAFVLIQHLDPTHAEPDERALGPAHPDARGRGDGRSSNRARPRLCHPAQPLFGHERRETAPLRAARAPRHARARRFLLPIARRRSARAGHRDSALRERAATAPTACARSRRPAAW